MAHQIPERNVFSDWAQVLERRPFADIAIIATQDATHVSSFGSLFHFRPENKPTGASERYLDCSVAPRQTRIFGTHGQISGDGRLIEIYDFLQEEREIIDTAAGDDGSIRSGHGGGDYGLMDAFVAAVAQNDSSLIRSGAQESLESHLMVFADEKARLENRVVSLSEYGY